ncbi:MAG: hypothetical protein J5J06_02900 [Phycisphaerae bacterium]|nr:hypothetical protein [Phycisphaerae bacterium]
MLDQFLADVAQAADEVRRLIRDHGTVTVPGPVEGSTWELSEREKPLGKLCGKVRDAADRARRSLAPNGPTLLSGKVDAIEELFLRFAADALYARRSNEPPASATEIDTAIGDAVKYRYAADGASTPEAARFTHSDDFMSVLWGERVFHFTKSQAAAIKLLWQAWERGGLSVAEETLGEAVGSIADRYRLLHTFRKNGKNHPAWGTMIVKAAKGTYRLAPPNSIENHQKSPNVNR